MRTVVVGTAGHIDHGKSELVAALTGTHPDRLREERERGITIDIGFASLALDGLVLSFVDVPGHERFVKNMLAGASGIDLVLLVIAADESVRPQTREHFAICRLLGLGRGVIALTKTDLVDPDLVDLATSEVRDFVKGSFLEDAPIVPVSSRTRAGIDSLVRSLREVGAAAPARDAAGPARLPVDRSFTMKGFGTVVTGTLIAGSLAPGDDVEILTAGIRAKIRGLQVHGRPVERAVAGQRTAVNLQGVSHQEIARGDLIAPPGTYRATSFFDARISVLEESPAPLLDLARIRLHAGTAEILARIRPLGASEIAPGTGGYAQIRLERPAVLVPGDRFIVRRYSPATTLGGGSVIDAFPEKHRRASAKALASVRELETAGEGPEGEAGRAAWIVRSLGPEGSDPRSLTFRVGISWEQTRAALAPAVSRGEILFLGAGPELIVSREGFEEARRRSEAILAGHHRRHPLLPGMPLEELRGRVTPGLAPERARPLVAELARIGAIRIDRDAAALPTHRVSMSDSEERIASAIAAVFQEGGLNPPDPGEALAWAGASGAQGEALLAHLLRAGTLRRLRDGRLFHREALDGLRRRLQEYRKTSETIDIAAFKDLAGVTRKNAIPLLEHFDEERVTLRRGSERVILV